MCFLDHAQECMAKMFNEKSVRSNDAAKNEEGFDIKEKRTDDAQRIQCKEHTADICFGVLYQRSMSRGFIRRRR